MLSRRRFMSTALGAAAPAILPRPFALAHTPVSGEPVDPELWRYLSLSPLSVANPGQSMPFLAGNAQLQAETMGITLPVDMADEARASEWIRSMYNVALPSFVAINGMRDDFSSLTGFEIGQVMSGAEIGEPPSVVTLLRGTFDTAQIQQTQLALGYQQVDVDGRAVYSLSETDEFDPSVPVQRMALARLNNSTVLDDGTLVYASTLELLRTVLTPVVTLASLPEVQRAANTLDTPLITSALLGPGAFLLSIPPEFFEPENQDEIVEAIRDQMNQEPPPIVLTAIAGNSPGGPLPSSDLSGTPVLDTGPKSLSKFALVYATPDDVFTAASQIQERLASGFSAYSQQPWTELFAATEAVPNLDQSSVLLTIEWNGRAASTTDLIFRRDLGFISG